MLNIPLLQHEENFTPVIHLSAPICTEHCTPRQELACLGGHTGGSYLCGMQVCSGTAFSFREKTPFLETSVQGLFHTPILKKELKVLSSATGRELKAGAETLTEDGVVLIGNRKQASGQMVPIDLTAAAGPNRGVNAGVNLMGSLP